MEYENLNLLQFAPCARSSELNEHRREICVLLFTFQTIYKLLTDTGTVPKPTLAVLMSSLLV